MSIRGEGDATSYVLSVCEYQEENLSGWSIKRNADGEEVADYALGENVVLKPGAKLKVSICI